MNNNRNQNNNRRRGRGNRNQGGGGGNQGNRIDSRARGNAPQMLDKYKKLAEDAHRNGDRVQAEYYLQFADHYFRVIADNRTRQDEQRGGRRDEREQDDYEADFDDDGENGRRFESQRERPRREDRPRRDERPRPMQDERIEDGAPIEASEGPAFEPDDNPFVRETREAAPARAKRAPRQRRDNGQEPGIDAAVLPPAFSANDTGDRVEERGEDEDGAERAPTRRRKRNDGGTLSAVG